MRRAISGLIIFAATITMIEFAARVVTWRGNVLGTKREIYYFSRGPHLDSGQFGDLIPGESVWMMWHLRPYTVEVNTQGLRNDEDVDMQAVRILAIGDSFTFGPYVPNQDTWPAIMQTELRNASPGISVQLLNAGVAGYTITQELSYLKAKGLGLKPDLVILGFHPSDIQDLRKQAQELFPRPIRKWKNAISWLSQRSAVVHVARSVAKDIILKRAEEAIKANQAPEVNEMEMFYQEYSRHFRDMADLLNREDVAFAVIGFPNFFKLSANECPETAPRFVKGLTAELDVPYLDLLSAFQEHRLEDLYLVQYDAKRPLTSDPCFSERDRYVGNGHLSRFGYQVTGRAVARWVHSLGLVPIK